MHRLLLALALSTALSSPALAQQDISKVNGSITAEAGKQYDELDTVNGSIRIERGASVASAETVNGSITVEDEAQAGALETVNGAIRLGRNVVVAESAETVNGAVRVDEDSRVEGAVSTVNGAITLSRAEVGRGLSTVSGDITVGADSVVRGGIHVEKPHGFSLNWFGTQRDPRVVIGPNAVVEGSLVFEREVELFVHDSARIGPVSGAQAKRYSGNEP